MKWYQVDTVIDEMWMGLCIVIIACTAILKGTDIDPVSAAVASSAITGLGVYLGVKPKKKKLNGNGGDNEPPTT